VFALVALVAMTAAPAASASSEAVGRGFIEQVSSGQFAAASASFTEQMKAGMPPDNLALMWRDMQSRKGGFRKIERVTVEPVGDGTAQLVTCRFANGAATFEVYVDSTSHIAGFFLTPAPIIARRFIAELAKSNFDGAEAYFTEKMRASLPPSKLAALWKDLVAQSGEFQQIDRASVQAAQGDWAAVVTVSFARSSVVLRVVVDGEARIEGFSRQ
jgi:hypothetical protein